MEIGEGFIGNATGGIGQGLAYVLPETKSEDYAMQLAQRHSQQLAQNAALRIKRQQELQDQLHKEFTDQKLPDYYAPYDKAIIEANTAWQKKAADYNVKTGKNPFANPELMGEYNKNVVALAKKSKDIGENYSKTRAIAIGDNGEKYTEESITDVIKYEDLIKNNPMAALDKPIPQLKRKPATEIEFDKTVTATPIKNNDGTYDTTKPNLAAIKKQVYSNILSDPKFAPLLKKYGYNTEVPDFPVYNKDGNRIWYTNPTFLNKTALDILENPESPEILKSFGINPNDTYVKEKLMDLIKNQNETMAKFVIDRSDAIAARVTQDQSRVYGAENNAMAKRRLNLAESREERLSEDDDNKPKVTDFTVIEKTFTRPDPKDRKKQIATPAHFPKYVAVTPVAFAQAQLKNAYDVRKAKNVNLPADASIKMTGIGWGDVQGGKKSVKVSLVNSDGTEYIINESDIPLKTKNDDYYKAARKALGDAPEQAKKADTKKVDELRTKYRY